MSDPYLRIATRRDQASEDISAYALLSIATSLTQIKDLLDTEYGSCVDCFHRWNRHQLEGSSYGRGCQAVVSERAATGESHPITCPCTEPRPA